MKKILLLAFLAIAAMACEGPAGPRGPEGPRGEGTNWDVQGFKIEAADWVRLNTPNPNELLYRVDVVPEIFTKLNAEDREYIYEYGSVFGYIFVIDQSNNSETQTPLPYVINWAGNNYESLVETYYFDYTPNDVAFYVSYSGNNLNYHPGLKYFRIVMNW